MIMITYRKHDTFFMVGRNMQVITAKQVIGWFISFTQTPCMKIQFARFPAIHSLVEVQLFKPVTKLQTELFHNGVK